MFYVVCVVNYLCFLDPLENEMLHIKGLSCQ